MRERAARIPEGIHEPLHHWNSMLSHRRCHWHATERRLGSSRLEVQTVVAMAGRRSRGFGRLRNLFALARAGTAAIYSKNFIDKGQNGWRWRGRGGHYRRGATTAVALLHRVRISGRDTATYRGRGINS